MAQAGLILTIVHGWSILVEVLFGMICDLAPAGATACLLGGDRDGAAMDRRRDAAPWFAAGRGRGLAAGTAASGDGWVLSNLAHGAWALEQGNGVVARGQVFGAGLRRAWPGRSPLPGLLWSDRQGGMDDFYILLLTLIGAPLVHGWLIWRVAERAGPASGRLDWPPGEALPRLHRLACGSVAGGPVSAGRRAYGRDRQQLSVYRPSASALPEWGTPGILTQSLAAMVGPASRRECCGGSRPADAGLGLCANLMLALALPLLPVGQVAPLMAWSAGSGATMAVDFMLLRVVLGQRLDRDRMHGGDAPAAPFTRASTCPSTSG
jgi:hypothetical protein